MAGWIILGVIAALLVGLLCLRIGIRISFGEKLYAAAQIGPVRLQLLPLPDRGAARQKSGGEPVRTGQRTEKGHRPELHLTAAELREALRAVWHGVQRALRRAGRRIRIDPLDISIVFGDENPVHTAEWYGWANAAVWTVMPRLEELVRIPAPRIHMEMDFSAVKTSASGTVGLRCRIGDLLAIGFAAAGPLLRFGIPFLKKQRAAQRNAPQKAAKQEAEAPDGVS